MTHQNGHQPAIRNRIEELLPHHPVSRIARDLRVDRKTVRRIRDGFKGTSPPRRCPKCGGLVYGRCRLCHVRSLPRNGNW